MCTPASDLERWIDSEKEVVGFMGAPLGEAAIIRK